MSSLKTILIVDAGSTKTDWCLINSGGRILNRFVMHGVNVAVAPKSDVTENFACAFEKSGDFPHPDVIYYYGAGCSSPEICSATAAALSDSWRCREVEVASDMLAACRALLGHEPGVACILGTGSNSALYDGARIIANTPPLGFILGDEGGGASLGKHLISDIFKGQAPPDIADAFAIETGLTKDEVIRRVYREPNANRFLASFARFIARHTDNPYIRMLVTDEFKSFIRRNLLNYPHINELPVSFIGSVAVHYKDFLLTALEYYSLRTGEILTSPMPGLINYHRTKQ